MDRTASQLSYEGLLALHETVRERQLAVFFRNSHFSTMLKYNGELYLLCTDIAFGTSHVCWERLDEVDGDTTYCDADFQVFDLLDIGLFHGWIVSDQDERSHAAFAHLSY